MTGYIDGFIEGDHNAVCYECGQKRKASQLKKHWKGYYVCPEHWEARHTQDFVRGVPETITPPWVQARPADAFLNGGDFLITEDTDAFRGNFNFIQAEDGQPIVEEA